jgi:hypothetical protein
MDGVAADSPSCESLLLTTSTSSAARTTMELLGAKVNRSISPGSQLITWSESTWAAHNSRHRNVRTATQPQWAACSFSPQRRPHRLAQFGRLRPQGHRHRMQIPRWHRGRCRGGTCLLDQHGGSQGERWRLHRASRPRRAESKRSWTRARATRC